MARDKDFGQASKITSVEKTTARNLPWFYLSMYAIAARRNTQSFRQRFLSILQQVNHGLQGSKTSCSGRDRERKMVGLVTTWSYLFMRLRSGETHNRFDNDFGQYYLTSHSRIKNVMRREKWRKEDGWAGHNMVSFIYAIAVRRNTQSSGRIFGGFVAAPSCHRKCLKHQHLIRKNVVGAV